MRPQLKALVEAFAEDVDDLITELVEERIAPIKAVLAKAGMATPTEKVTGKAPRKLAQTRPRAVYDDAFQKKIAAHALKLPPEERRDYAQSQGVDKSRLYAWMRKWSGFTRAKADAEAKTKGNARKRKFYTDDFKRATVAKGLTLAPGDRQVFLGNEGVDVELYRKWVTWAKKNPG